MKKELTVSQAIIMVSLSVLSLKFILLPSLLATTAKQDLWITALVIFVSELVTYYFLLQMWQKNPDKTFFQVIEEGMGKAVKNICAIIAMVYYMGKTLLAVFETQSFVDNALYQNYNWLSYIIPLALFMVYMASKDFKIFGRMVQALLFVFILGCVTSIVLPIFEVDFSNILPILSNGISPIYKCVLKYNFWFGEFLVFIMMMGRIKLEKHMTSKFLISYAVTGIFVIIFLITYYSLFKTTAGLHRIAISDMGHFLPQYNHFRVDWISDVIWTTAEIFQSAVGLYLIKLTFTEIFPDKSPRTLFRASNIFIIAVSIVLIIVSNLKVLSLNSLIRFIETYFGYLSLAMNLLPTLLFIALQIIKLKKKYEKNKTYNSNNRKINEKSYV